MSRSTLGLVLLMIVHSALPAQVAAQVTMPLPPMKALWGQRVLVVGPDDETTRHTVEELKRHCKMLQPVVDTKGWTGPVIYVWYTDTEPYRPNFTHAAIVGSDRGHTENVFTESPPNEQRVAIHLRLVPDPVSCTDRPATSCDGWEEYYEAGDRRLASRQKGTKLPSARPLVKDLSKAMKLARENY